MTKNLITRCVLMICTALLSVQISSACTATITPTGPTSFCSGSRALTLKANVGASYQWQLNGVNITTATARSYKPNATGIYTVIVTATGGCSATSSGFSATSLPLPAPVVVSSGPPALCIEPGVSLYNTKESGNAMSFDGVNDYISFTTSPVYTSNRTTVEAWINTTTTSPNAEIAGWTNVPAARSVEFRLSNGKLQFGIWNGTAWQVITSVASVNTGSWVHVAAVKQISTVSLYINGALDNSGTITNVITPTTFNIGASSLPSSSYYFSGKIDELRVWNTVRTAAQILSNKDKTIPGTTVGLVAYYKFDEGTGTKISDAKTNTYTGTLVNGPTWQIPSSAPVGTSAVSYLWSTGSTAKNIQVTSGGIYSLTITASNGCSKKSADFTVAAPLAVDIITDRCATPSITGQFEGVTSGGTLPFNITWCCPTTQFTTTTNDPVLHFSPAGATWTFSVTDASGCSASASKVMCSSPFKVSDQDAETKKITAYPNPFNSKLTLDVMTDEELTVEVRDLTGKLVQCVQHVTQKLEIENEWPAGIYSIRIQNESGSFERTLKVIKAE